MGNSLRMEKVYKESSTSNMNNTTNNSETIVLPAADAQKRLWFIDQLLPQSPVYNIYRAIRIEGELNVKALHSAMNAMIARHESLRTTFDVELGKVVQKIHPSLEIDMPYTDLCNDDESNIYNSCTAKITTSQVVVLKCWQCPHINL